MKQLKLSTYYGAAAPAPRARSAREQHRRVRRYGFVDLFCGIGGASQGATEAGLPVLLAVDSCKQMLHAHAQNHPGAKHVCAELPALPRALLPSKGRWHLHGSPPCTTLSCLNKSATDAERAQGLALVTWYLEFALASGATTWSMEQVPVREVVDAVREVARRHPGRVDHCIVDCSRLGVPQTRRRLIAGTPALVDKLRLRRSARRAVQDVIARPRGTHTRPEITASSPVRKLGGVRVRRRRVIAWDEMCRPISDPAHTVTAKNGLRWASPGSGTQPFKMNLGELLSLQTFPPAYKLGCSKTCAMRGIGNALPPRVMCELLQPLRAQSAHTQTC